MTWTKRAWYGVKTIVARHPSVAIPAARFRGHGVVAGPETQLVIEGFPRAGSSFAVAAFQRAQPEPVRIAHHVHAPAQVLYAVRRRVPALVLIREPEDAVLSHVIRTPAIGLEGGLRGYLRFYEPLLPVRDRICVASFKEVVTDFGDVIDRMNASFGTSFDRFEHTPASAEAVLREIEEDELTRTPPGEEFERVVPRPSELRRKLKEELRGEYRADSLAGLRRRADELYARFEG